jgi:acyl carrier protein
MCAGVSHVTRERIRRFISDTFFVDAFGDDESFLRSGILDSLGMMQLVAFLDSGLGVKVEDSELVPENLDSVASVVAYVARKQQAAANAA